MKTKFNPEDPARPPAEPVRHLPGVTRITGGKLSLSRGDLADQGGRARPPAEHSRSLSAYGFHDRQSAITQTKLTGRARRTGLKTLFLSLRLIYGQHDERRR